MRSLTQFLGDLDSMWRLVAHWRLIITVLGHHQLRLASIGVNESIPGVRLPLNITLILYGLHVGARMTLLCDLKAIRLFHEPRLLLQDLNLLLRNRLDSL